MISQRGSRVAGSEQKPSTRQCFFSLAYVVCDLLPEGRDCHLGRALFPNVVSVLLAVSGICQVRRLLVSDVCGCI